MCQGRRVHLDPKRPKRSTIAQVAAMVIREWVNAGRETIPLSPEVFNMLPLFRFDALDCPPGR